MTHQAPYQGQVIWIIGASSGIGRALALDLARRGAQLAISARRKEALDTLIGELDGADHKAFAMDIADCEVVTRTAEAIRATYGRIDRVIFMAAQYTPMALDQLDMPITRQIVTINLTGAFHVVHAVLPIFAEQSHGQIALCGSVAGYVGLPNGQPYSATKAGIINLAESLRAEVPKSIDVKLISPGFVRTELTDKNDFDMPMIISAEQAAVAIARGLTRRGFEIHFPKGFTFLLKLVRLLPYRVALALTRKMGA